MWWFFYRSVGQHHAADPANSAPLSYIHADPKLFLFKRPCATEPCPNSQPGLTVCMRFRCVITFQPRKKKQLGRHIKSCSRWDPLYVCASVCLKFRYIDMTHFAWVARWLTEMCSKSHMGRERGGCWCQAVCQLRRRRWRVATTTDVPSRENATTGDR